MNNKIEKESLDDCIKTFERFIESNDINKLFDEDVLSYLKELKYLRKLCQLRFMKLEDVKDKYPKIDPTQMSMFVESSVTNDADSTKSKEDRVFG